MRITLKRVLLWTLAAIVLFFAISVAINWTIIQRVFLGGLHVHETVAPPIPGDFPRPAILVFSKTNAFRHEEAIPAGNALFAQIAKDKGWGYFQTENGAAFSPEILARFDAVVFNNVSGDVFSPAQQQAFKAFLESGGGYVGLHAAGDSSHKEWSWYTNEIIGANFTQHTMSPQFQDAKVMVEDTAHPSVKGLPASWTHNEEWYSFDKSPRSKGFHVIATVDENSYKPVGMFDKDLRMGDHPAVWSRCIGASGQPQGRALYTIFGHKAEAFAEPEVRSLLTEGLGWAIRQEGQGCAPVAAVEPMAAQAK